MRKFLAPILLLIVLAGFSACAQQETIGSGPTSEKSFIPTSTGSTSPEISLSIPFFPTEKEPANTYMLALLRGRLALDRGFLAIEPLLKLDQPAPAEIRKSTLVIWPYGYSLSTFNQKIAILDATGRPLARIGDILMLGGGGIPDSSAEQIVGYPLPPGFTGSIFYAAPNTYSPYIPFQVSDYAKGPYPASSQTGTLLIIDNLVRQKTIEGKSFLLIWPHGYYIFIEGQTWRIYDRDGRTVALAGSGSRAGEPLLAGDNITWEGVRFRRT